MPPVAPVPPRHPARPTRHDSVWRAIADRAKRSRAALHLADRLGRGTGRFRLLDHLARPATTALPLPNPASTSPTPPPPAPTALHIGHATVLFRLGDLHILTDPVFSTRIGLGLGLLTAGPARLLPPALTLTQLPPIDLILVSHAHFDHLDRPSLARLARTPRPPPVLTAPGCADLLSDLGFPAVTELPWHHTHQLGPLAVTSLPAKHWGARVFADTHRGYAAFLLQHGPHRILFGADSAHFDGWAPLASTGGVDLACVGIGAYDPYVAAHATPEQALDMARRAGARAVLPMHHSVFRLSREPPEEPLQRFRAAAHAAQLTTAAELPGQRWTLPP